MFVFRFSAVRRWLLRLGMLVFSLAVLSLSPARAQTGPAPDGPDGTDGFARMFPEDIEATLVSTATTSDGYSYWRWEVDSGCIYGDHTYTINMALDTSRLAAAELSMGNDDVDWNDPQGCAGGSEVDTVDFNGYRLGELSGANESWSLNTFSLAPGMIQFGANELFIDTDSTHTGCWCVGVNYIELRAKNGFQVYAYSPSNNEPNRDFHKDKLDLKAAFTLGLDSTSLGPNAFKLEYIDNNGNRVQVPGSFEMNGSSGFRFVPSSDLLDGIRYYATIIGGPGGIQAFDGTDMDNNFSWEFFTAVDFTRSDNFQAPNGYSICGASGQPCDALELTVYQTARNAPILPGKPAIARLYTRWNLHPNVLDSEQVRRVEMDVRLTGPGGLDQKTRTYIGRWDLYAAQNRLGSGDHTIKLPFTPTDGGVYTVEITPVPQKNITPLRFTASRSLPTGNAMPPLIFNYYMVKGGDWAGGVPEPARLDGLSDMLSGSLFTTDNLPTHLTGFLGVGELLSEYTYTGNMLTDSCGTVREVSCKIGNGTLVMDEARCINFHMVYAQRGEIFTAASAPQAVCPLVTAFAITPKKLLLHMAGSPSNDVTIAHEIAHLFNITRPGTPDYPHRLNPAGTEGWNVRTGASYSYEENPVGFETLMNPVNQPSGKAWIHNEDYLALLNSPFGLRAERQADDSPYLNLGGMIDLDANTAMIEPLMLLDEAISPDASNPAGMCQATLLDSSAGVLHQVGFDPGMEMILERDPNVPQAASRPEHWAADTLDAGGPQPFRLVLPWNEQAHSLRIACNGSTLLTQTRTVAAPTLNFTNVSDNDILTGIEAINWTSSDTDGAPAKVQVQISYDGGTTWKVLSGLIEGTSFTLDTTRLSAGNNLKLRLAGSDGFNTGFAVRTVTISNPLQVVMTNPKDNQNGILRGADIAVTFSAPMNTATLEGALEVFDGGVNLVENYLSHYDPETRTAVYRAARLFEADAEVVVHLAASVEDMYGNSLPDVYTWNFSILTDEEPPVVEEISPAEDSLGAPTNAYIQLKFSEKLYYFSVTPSSFYVTGPGGNVAGTTDFRDRAEANGHRLTYLLFRPSTELAPNTTYTVHLTGAIRDINGTPMVPAEFSFTTGEGPYSGLARTTGRITDQPVDTDGDGMIDTLRFMVEIEVRAIDSYNVNARLIDKNGLLLEWAYNQKSQSPGVYWVPLDFPAAAIAAGAGGPFELSSMSIYAATDTSHPAAWIPPYYTLPYRASLFGGLDPDSLLLYLPLMQR